MQPASLYEVAVFLVQGPIAGSHRCYMLMATLVVSYSRDSTVSPSCTHIFTSPQFFLIFHSVTWARRGGVDVLLRAKHTAIVYHSAFLSVKGPTVTVTHCQKKLL